MLYEESGKATVRKTETDYYQKSLRESEKKRKSQKKKVIKPENMPWENSPQGIIKHLFNETSDLQIEAVDAYMQLVPAGSRSGKHRHMSEEFIFVLEGKGYDLHWDVDYELDDKYYWKVDETPSRWEWEQGDSIYIPPNTVHQHFNADSQGPARFICATSRMIRLIGFDDLEQIEKAPEYGK